MSFLYAFLLLCNKNLKVFLGVSLLLESLSLSFTQNFDLPIQSCYSNLALNNRQSSNFWCITEKTKQSSSVYGLLSGIVQLFHTNFHWGYKGIFTGQSTSDKHWTNHLIHHLSMKVPGAPTSLQRNFKTTIRCLQLVQWPTFTAKPCRIISFL